MERKKEIYQILRNTAKGVVIYFIQALVLMEKEKKKHSFLFSQVYLVENRFRESVL